MAMRLQLTRLLWLALLLCLAFAGLGYRLIDLQILRHRELNEQALQNTQNELLLEPRRGDILDVRGNILATTVFVKTVCADPTLIGTQQVVVAHALAPLLEIKENVLVQSLTPKLRQNSKGEVFTNRYCVLKRKVPLDTWEKIQSAMPNLTLSAEHSTHRKGENSF